MNPRRRLRSCDKGFTLVELAVTIVIMGIIAVPATAFLFEFFVNESTTTGRVSESHDEQVAATYFAQDVANVGTRDASLNAQQSVWPGSFPAGSCGSSVAAANQILLLAWDNTTWNSATSTETKRVYSAAYVEVATTDETQLHRLYCQGSTVTSGTTQISDTVLAHNLNPNVTPTVNCTSPSTCTSASVPSTIRLDVGIRHGVSGAQPFTLSLTGQRRQT